MDKSTFEELLATLDQRFEENMERHPGIEWQDVKARLEANPDKVKSLHEMERTGGEPDVIGFDSDDDDVFIYCDCAAQSPTGRRSVRYDQNARAWRKKHPPSDSAMEMAEVMGSELLDEEQYRQLQTLGAFDTKTSSRIKTPDDVRKLGGALFCDRRYGRVRIPQRGGLILCRSRVSRAAQGIDRGVMRTGPTTVAVQSKA